MDFDIEDVGKRLEYDDIVGYTDDSDIEACAENCEINDYKAALDMFGDDECGVTNDEDIDPLTFIPRTASDFSNLKTKLVKIVANVEPKYKAPFIAALIDALTRDFHKLQLAKIMDLLHI